MEPSFLAWLPQHYPPSFGVSHRLISTLQMYLIAYFPMEHAFWLPNMSNLKIDGELEYCLAH